MIMFIAYIRMHVGFVVIFVNGYPHMCDLFKTCTLYNESFTTSFNPCRIVLPNNHMEVLTVKFNHVTVRIMHTGTTGNIEDYCLQNMHICT